MSTSEEVREQQPDPVDLVTQFEQSVDDLVTISEKVREAPSVDIIDDFYAHAFAVKTAVQPLFEQRFFLDQNELLIDVSVSTIIGSGDALHEKSRQIVGDEVELWRFSDGVRETLTSSLIERDMTPFGTVTSKSGEEVLGEDAFEVLSAELAKLLNEQFSQIVDQYVESVLSDDGVHSFVTEMEGALQAEAERIYRQSERIDKAKLLGAVVAAAFAGTYLANKLQKRN